MKNSWRVLVALLGLVSTLVSVGPAAGEAANRTIVGKVTRLGEPVVGVGVSLYSEAAGIARVTCTDENGSYRFRRVPVGAVVELATGTYLSEPTGVEGASPCTNWEFEAPSGRDWLSYRHPDTYGVWLARPNFVVPAGDGRLRINIKLKAALRVCAGNKATLWGTGGDDQLAGTAGDDVIIGKGGNDLIEGKSGLDLICGDAGNDRLKGGAGSDVLVGGNGSRDRMVGGGGFDICVDQAFKKADCESVFP